MTRLRMKYRKPKEDPESDDYDSENEDTSEDDDYKYKSQNSCFGTSKVAYYFLLGLVLISSLAFLNERDLRMKLMTSSTLVTLDSPFNAIEASRKDLATDPLNCSECPSCEDSNEAAALPTDMEEIANGWRGRNQRLQAQVQSFARILLDTKFGKPPYYIEFAINVDSEEGVKMNGEITVELNNAEYLPYSTYYFLSQISAGVWNNCGFFISLGVVYLDEARGPEYGGSCDRTAFASSSVLKDLGVPEFLAMQEYHPNVYHDAHSLGMSGRPGGLGLYFNAQNNTKTLRPKSGSAGVLGGPPSEGDPNLGRIVNGDDFLIKLKRLEHQTEGGETERLMQDIGKFLRVVTITSAKIVSK